MAKQWHQLERLDHKALKKLQLEREKAAKLAAQQELRQKSIIIGGIIVAAFIFLIVIGVTIKNKHTSRITFSTFWMRSFSSL